MLSQRKGFGARTCCGIVHGTPGASSIHVSTKIFIAMTLCAIAVSTTRADRAPATVRQPLPAPQRGGGMELSAALASRRSARTFGPRDLELTEKAQLLWAAQGVVSGGRRTAPSAGALYPLTIRIVDRAAVWRYVPGEHALVRELPGDRRAELAAASESQHTVRGGSAVFVLTAEPAITARKYGASRGERFAILEAGHAAQNLLLTATALGLHAVPVGALDDAAVRRVLGLSKATLPLYLIPIGAPP